MQQQLTDSAELTPHPVQFLVISGAFFHKIVNGSVVMVNAKG